MLQHATITVTTITTHNKRDSRRKEKNEGKGKEIHHLVAWSLVVWGITARSRVARARRAARH